MSVAGVSVHMDKMVYAWMADPAGLRPVSWCFYCFSHRESYRLCEEGIGGGSLYLRRIYAHFHLARLHDPTVDAPHVVRSLVPTIRQCSSTCPCLSILLLLSSVSFFFIFLSSMMTVPASDLV